MGHCHPYLTESARYRSLKDRPKMWAYSSSVRRFIVFAASTIIFFPVTVDPVNDILETLGC